MLVSELIAILQTYPQDVIVEVNDNNGGCIYGIEQVDFFSEEQIREAAEDSDDWDDNTPTVIIQVNC